MQQKPLEIIFSLCYTTSKKKFDGGDKKVKAVIFDFDGTLTKLSQNVWKQTWSALGYETGEGSYYRQLFAKFLSGEITHSEWIEFTCKAYMERGLDKQTLLDIGSSIEMHDGFEEMLIDLKKKGYSLHIVSGNIGDVVENVLKDKVKYFDSINTNSFKFDEGGKLVDIVGTNYDYQGKADFVNTFITNSGSKASEVTFVGNGDNDEWVYTTGCETICVNPDKTDADNKTIWHNAVKNLTDLRQLLPIIYSNSAEKRR